MAWRHRTLSLIASLALVGIICSSCVRAPEVRQYELSGQILEIKPAAHEVLIKHGDIKGFMPGMTMPFKVHNASLLEGKTRGDLVTATLMVAPDEAWLSTLQKTGSAPLPEEAAIATTRSTILNPGDLVPDTSLIDERHQPISLSAWRGSAVAITFIYTRCPLPQFCPLMDRRFRELQALIKADRALRDRARLLSVSFDPAVDRPEVLQAHARKLGADPAIWSFATAPAETIDGFAAAFGVTVIREADRSITHNLRTAVIGPDGKVVSTHSGGDWTVEQLATEMRQSLR